MLEITLARRELLDYRLGGGKRIRTYIKDMNKRMKNLCDRPIPEADGKKMNFSTLSLFYSSYLI